MQIWRRAVKQDSTESGKKEHAMLHEATYKNRYLLTMTATTYPRLQT
jgi:hypothetical protein